MAAETEQTAAKETAQDENEGNCCIQWILHIQEEANYTDSEDEADEHKTKEEIEKEENKACFMSIVWFISWFCMIAMFGTAIFMFVIDAGIVGLILLFVAPIQHWLICYMHQRKAKVRAKRTAIRATRMCCCGFCECIFCSDD